MDIVVLAGGLSTERDVSFKTGSMVAAALRKNGHRVILLDVFMGYAEAEMELEGAFERAEEMSIRPGDIPETAPDLAAVKASRKDQSDCFFGPNVIRLCQMADIVFMALHGENGENGKLQAAFDLLGIKYTGSDYLGSAIAMNKELAKKLFAEAGVPVPRSVTMEKAKRQEDVAELPICLPCVVKPNCGGSSIGVTIVRDAAEFRAALDAAFQWEDSLLVEEYIGGREFSVGVMEGRALPVIEIAPIEGFYDYRNKYKAGSAVETCPAELPEETAAQMQRYAEMVAAAIGLDTYSRADFLLNEEGEIFCLEVNTLPGMTPTSLLPQEAAAVGMDYGALCEKIIEISLKKREGI
ncbi:MAG: D-alanine--D-alanine ligase [Muribaculaceae bacterium]|nr:D-alanine--D-alanine ligase [Roseburia sp.]MCM1431563.1 D-alanine--D-alanine ligase [Muribaculaceae bacterium]MCM1492028.1 D-alanine--D-alanine ligase [Muribaculaceae bacterium]